MRKHRNDQDVEQIQKDVLSERAFMQSIVAAVMGIVICLASLSAVTWAWFCGGVSSATNTIETKSYTLTMDIKKGDRILNKGPLLGYGYYEMTLNADTTYEVLLIAEGTGKNGYCKVTVGDRSYFTNLVTIENGSDADASFGLNFTNTTSEPVFVRFDLCWGTYSGVPQIENGGNYCIDTDANLISPIPENE